MVEVLAEEGGNSLPGGSRGKGARQAGGRVVDRGAAVVYAIGMTPTVAEVLAELEFSRGYFPREAVQAAVRLGSAIVEPLIASIAFATCEHADLPRDYVLHLSALHVLAELRERRAYPAIVALCRLTEPELDELIGFVLTESLPQILASVALDDDSLLRGLVEDASVSEWVRAGAIHAMACCAVEGTIAHDRFLAYFGELWRGGRLLRQANAVWDEMACVATDLGLSEFLADIERAFDEGFLDGMMIGREDAVEELSGSPDRFQPRSQKRYRFLPDAAAELGRWHGMWRVSGEECTQPVVQSARRQQKVGRNDRCPCGSGKKYKKCCLQLGGDAGATAGM